MYLVVLLHSLCTFGYPLFFDWAVIDKDGSNRIYESIMLTLDTFLMPHLIFLSALFIFISLENKSKIQYLKKRFNRLYLPVIVYLFCAGDMFFQFMFKRLNRIDTEYAESFVSFW